nr:DNA-processing protein DprA [uncultured Roseateles sp.]
MDRDELGSWLRLLETPGVGRESARRLLAAFGSPEGVFTAEPAAWRSVVGAPIAADLAQPPGRWEALLKTTWDWLQAPSDTPRSLLALGDADYPEALLQTADPPLLLYLDGRREWLGRPGLAIVGSRSASPQGCDNARGLARELSQAGWCIVSGLALGIDGAAHEGALQGPGGTIAVVGTGLDIDYPKRHRELARRIANNGLLVSEYPLGTAPLAGNFPQRNRLIAGLANGTLVVEAALQSGSLITARLAAEAGREVFAIPGSIHASLSRGCHQLIQQGAKLVATAQDILDELRPDQRPGPRAAPPEPAAVEDSLLQALGHDPVSLDALMARTGEDAAQLSARLLELELDGQVQRLPGQLFQRRMAG